MNYLSNKPNLFGWTTYSLCKYHENECGGILNDVLFILQHEKEHLTQRKKRRREEESLTRKQDNDKNQQRHYYSSELLLNLISSRRQAHIYEYSTVELKATCLRYDQRNVKVIFDGINMLFITLLGMSVHHYIFVVIRTTLCLFYKFKAYKLTDMVVRCFNAKPTQLSSWSNCCSVQVFEP